MVGGWMDGWVGEDGQMDGWSNPEARNKSRQRAQTERSVDVSCWLLQFPAPRFSSAPGGWPPWPPPVASLLSGFQLGLAPGLPWQETSGGGERFPGSPPACQSLDWCRSSSQGSPSSKLLPTVSGHCAHLSSPKEESWSQPHCCYLQVSVKSLSLFYDHTWQRRASVNKLSLNAPNCECSISFLLGPWLIQTHNESRQHKCVYMWTLTHILTHRDTK